MTRFSKTSALCAVAALASFAAATAHAQSTGSAGLSGFQSGYGNARAVTNTVQTGSTRDANGNRLIVDGIIQSGASSYSRSSGAGSSYSGAGSSGSGTTIGGSTAIGNNLNVVVQGSHNTVIVNSKQVNNGNISAGTSLNGTLNLND